MEITIERAVAAPLDAVWRAWTTPDDIRHWNAASPDWHCPSAELDLREGGRFSYRMEARDGSAGFDFAGTFTRVGPHALIAYEIADGRAVSVEFVPGPREVLVRETFEAESTHPVELQRQGWQAILDSFGRHVEGGAG